MSNDLRDDVAALRAERMDLLNQVAGLLQRKADLHGELAKLHTQQAAFHYARAKMWLGVSIASAAVGVISILYGVYRLAQAF